MATRLEKLIEQAQVQKPVTRHLGNGQLRVGWICSADQPASRRFRILPNYHMLYLVRGRGRFIDSDHHPTNLTAGIRLDRHPAMPHTIERASDGLWLEFFITLSPSLHQAFIELGMLYPHRVIQHMPVTVTLLKTCIRLIDDLQVPAFIPADKIVLQLASLLSRFEQVARTQDDAETQRDQMQRAAHLLTDPLHQHTPLPDLAKQVCMNYESFRKHFSETYGSSPQQYRIEHRIRQAQYQLLETDMSVQEMAQLLGYPDVFSFSRQFKATCGKSPTAYRRQF
ncbi:MAG: helix-turn-helix transcriptional regulator [Phycisphaeraceae bacterium]|nr:helix-turn-helix transcriptional regulator [Phycisphaeraceae bacterium]